MPDFAFRLPAIGNLTLTQQIALDEPRQLLVTGGPGSGKTVVSIFRFLNEIGQSRKALFFTYNRTLMSSIRGTLRQRASILLPDLTSSEVEQIARNQIGSIYEWYAENCHATLSNDDQEAIAINFTTHLVNRNNLFYSELIIDEAQDLRPAIIKNAYRIAEKVSCGADRSQDIQGHYAEPADDAIFTILNAHRPTLRQGLTQNFRNTKQIFSFARNFVPHDHNVQAINLEELPEGDDPDLRVNLSEEDQLKIIVEIVKQNPGSNIGIIVHFTGHVKLIKNHFIGNGYSPAIDAPEETSFSYYYSDMPRIDRNSMEMRLRTPFVLTYDSCKGLEFDIVIMPFFESADWALRRFRSGENGIQRPLITPSHYYVAATRARSQLYLLGSRIPGILSFIE